MMLFNCLFLARGGRGGGEGRKLQTFPGTLSITTISVLINIACVCVVETFFLWADDTMHIYVNKEEKKSLIIYFGWRAKWNLKNICIGNKRKWGGKKTRKITISGGRCWRISPSSWALQKAVMVDKRTPTLLPMEPIQRNLHFNQMNVSIVPVRIRGGLRFPHLSVWNQSAFSEFPVDEKNDHFEGRVHARRIILLQYKCLYTVKKTHLNVLYGLWTKWCFLACCIDDANYNCSSTHFWNKTLETDKKDNVSVKCC